MAAINRNQTYSCEVKFANNKNAFVGFDYTIINNDADAKVNNYDIIRIEPYTIRKDDISNYYGWDWQKVALYVTYDGSTTKKYFHRRYDIRKGSEDTKYYFKATTDPNWVGSGPTQNTVAQNGLKKGNDTLINELQYLNTHDKNYGLEIKLYHNEDGTPKSNVTITLGGNRDDGYGDGTKAKPSTTFTLPNIARGTKIYQRVNGSWQKVANIHLKGESSGAQHYIYKYNGTSWVKYYG